MGRGTTCGPLLPPATTTSLFLLIHALDRKRDLMRIAAVALAATLALAGAATAADQNEPPIANPDQVISSVSAESLAALVRELGAPQAEVRDAGGGEKIVVFSDGGIPYNLQAVMCDQPRPGKCIALALVVLLETSAGGYSLEALNGVNKSNLYLTFFKVDSSKIGVGNLQLIDGGVTKRNLAINIASFIVTFRETLKGLQSQTVAGLQQPGVFGQSPFQNTSGGPLLRPILASPRDIQSFVKQQGYATSLRR